MRYKYEVVERDDELGMLCTTCRRGFHDVPIRYIGNTWCAKWFKAKNNHIYCYQCIEQLEQENINFALGLEGGVATGA